MVQLLKPMHLYFESELRELCKAYTKRGQNRIAAEIAEEINHRQQETFHIEYGVHPGKRPKSGLNKQIKVKVVSLARIPGTATPDQHL